MRLSLVLVLILAGCGTAAEYTATPPPSVAELDRLASAGYQYGDRDMVECSAGVTEFVDLPTRGWLLEPKDGSEMEWVVLRISKDTEDIHGSTDVGPTVGAGTPFEHTGEVYLGLADYTTGTWVWDDCSDKESIAMWPSTDVHPWSESGFMYVCVVASGEGSRAIANGFASARWPMEGE